MSALTREPLRYVTGVAEEEGYESLRDFLVATAGTDDGHMWLAAATEFWYHPDDVALIFDAYVTECAEDGDAPDMRFFVGVTLEQDWGYDIERLWLDHWYKEQLSKLENRRRSA